MTASDPAAVGANPGTQPIRAAGACTLTATSGLVRRTITAPGPGGPTSSRSYQVYAPRGLSPRSSVPLLVSLHGLGSNGTVQNAISYWSSFDDQQAASGAPFVLVVPDGVATLWLWGLEDSYDVRFIFDLVAEVEGSGCIDPARIYVDGWSEGAYMAQRMACASGDPTVDPQGVVLAAVHSYAGGDPAVIPSLCRSVLGARPPSVLLSQGLDDTLVNARKMGFPAFQSWAARYSCSPPTAAFTAAQRLTGCRGEAAVDWWPIAGFTHFTWSCASGMYWHNRGVWAFLTKRVAPTATSCT